MPGGPVGVRVHCPLRTSSTTRLSPRATPPGRGTRLEGSRPRTHPSERLVGTGGFRTWTHRICLRAADPAGRSFPLAEVARLDGAALRHRSSGPPNRLRRRPWGLGNGAVSGHHHPRGKPCPPGVRRSFWRLPSHRPPTLRQGDLPERCGARDPGTNSPARTSCSTPTFAERRPVRCSDEIELTRALLLHGNVRSASLANAGRARAGNGERSAAPWPARPGRGFSRAPRWSAASPP